MQLEQNGTAIKKTSKLKGVLKKRSSFFLVLLLPLCGCQHVKTHIPDGKYISAGSKEYIIVKPSTMFFHLRVVDKSNVFIDREYEYNLWKDGEIFPNGIATGEYFPGIGKYDLYWDGKDIIAKEVNTANSIVLKKSLENARETQ